MRLRPLILLVSFCSGTLLMAQQPVPAPAPIYPVPSLDQLRWQDMEMNAFIHFSMNTFTDKEWGYGDEDPKKFTPSAVNAGQWVSTLKQAGFKGVILTAKHHDGFCLWPTAYTDHSIKSSPWKNGQGDIVRDVSNACKKNGLKFGVYLSPWDRHQATYGQPEYVDYYRKQLNELFTRYGNIFEMWFDGANGGDGYYGGARETRKINGATYYDWPTTLRQVRTIQPQVLFFSDGGPDIRWCGNERGVAGETNWNTITNDTLFAGKGGIEELLNTGSFDGDKWIPQETDVSIRPGWFYHRAEDSLVKTPQELFAIYLQSVGRGAQLLLNVPPDEKGLIHAEDIKSLRGFKKLIDETFRRNLAQGAKAEATDTRKDPKRFRAAHLTDGKPDTYWATSDSITKATITISLKQQKAIRYVVLREYIKLGQRVKSFVVNAWIDGAWKKITEGATIGHKRILPVEAIKTSRIQIEITDTKPCPVISEVALY